MGMNSATLSADLKSRLLSTFGIPTGSFDDSNMQKACDAIAQAVVNHIQTLAVVNVTSVSGVTTGISASGPGTGTIS